MARRTQIDEPLIAALARGETLENAAAAAGCSVRTAERRWAQREFKDRVIARQRREATDRQALNLAVWTRGLALLPRGIQAAKDIIEDPHAADRDKLRALQLLLDHFAPRQEPAAPRIPTAAQELVARWQEQEDADFAQVLFPRSGWGGSPQRSPAAPSRAGAPVVMSTPSASLERAPHGEVYAPPVPEPAPVQDRTPEPEPQVEEAPEPVQDWAPEPPPEPIPFRRPAPRGVEALDAEFERRMRGR